MCWRGNIFPHLVRFSVLFLSNAMPTIILGLKDFEVMTLTANTSYSKINMAIRNGFSSLK
jgi:hypothetical protein